VLPIKSIIYLSLQMLRLVGSEEQHFEERLMAAGPVLEQLEVADVSRGQLEALHRTDMPELWRLVVEGGVGLEDDPLPADSAGCRPALCRLIVSGLPSSTALSLARPYGATLRCLSLDVGTEQRVTDQLLELLPGLSGLDSLTLIRESEELHDPEACQSQRDDLEEQQSASLVDCPLCYFKVTRLQAPS
jgi:hypothetical protein